MRKSRKNPVLTSPWKIGMFVALMLAVTSAGVGYYFVHFYNIDLSWLDTSGSMWVVDSWSFFKETYPLVAGVVIISLMTYFIIASAVRRYKFYLSSGQDYRKMISLADSIDDLTNPAQIARLGEYPELQDILRSYGDQIKEISEQMGSMEDERSVDLEMEVEAILAGSETKEELSEGKWWVPLVMKVKEHVCSIREELEAVKAQAENGRRTSAQTALSLGRVMESLGSSNEDIIGIARAVGSLNSAVRELGDGASDASAPAAGPDASGSLISESLQALKTSSRTLHEFSEENNGLALNIALMAARGDISEHDLAQFAEKVRSTAERFNKLGIELSEIATKVSDVFAASGGAGGPSADSSKVAASIFAASQNIEKANLSLQEKVTSIGHELDSLNESVHNAISGESMDTGEAVEDQELVVQTSAIEGSEDSLVNFGDGTEEAGDEDELVLDRSDVWQAGSMLSDEAGQEDHSSEEDKGVEPVKGLAPGSGIVSLDDDDNEEVSLETPAPVAQAEEDEPVDIAEIAEEIPGSEAVENAAAGQAGDPAPEVSDGPRPGEDMMEMPGHKWVKIGMEDETVKDPGPAIETEEASGPAATASGDAPDEDGSAEMFMEKVADTIRGVTGMDVPDETDDDTIEEAAEEEEPIYDLFELGAIEYVEQTPGL